MKYKVIWRDLILLIVITLSLRHTIASSKVFFLKDHTQDPLVCFLEDKSYELWMCSHILNVERYDTWIDCGSTENYVIKYIVTVNDKKYTLSGHQIPECTYICQPNDYDVAYQKKISEEQYNYFLIEPNLDWYNKVNNSESFACYVTDDERVYKDPPKARYNPLLIIDIVTLVIFILSTLIALILFCPYQCICKSRDVEPELDSIRYTPVDINLIN